MFAPGAPTFIDGSFATYNGFSPSSVGNVLTQAQYNFLEAGIYHYIDDQTLGLFFLGNVPAVAAADGALIDQSDIFRDVGGVPGQAGRFSITIRGLPRLPGANGGVAPTTLASNAPLSVAALNNIATASGEEANGTNDAAAQAQSVEPAAGGDSQSASTNCWGDAVDAASAGQSATYSFDAGGADALAITACRNPS